METKKTDWPRERKNVSNNSNS